MIRPNFVSNMLLDLLPGGVTCIYTSITRAAGVMLIMQHIQHVYSEWTFFFFAHHLDRAMGGAIEFNCPPAQPPSAAL